MGSGTIHPFTPSPYPRRPSEPLAGHAGHPGPRIRIPHEPLGLFRLLALRLGSGRTRITKDLARVALHATHGRWMRVIRDSAKHNARSSFTNPGVDRHTACPARASWSRSRSPTAPPTKTSRGAGWALTAYADVGDGGQSFGDGVTK